jgi:peptide maturation system protein (TIGR04066 family)
MFCQSEIDIKVVAPIGWGLSGRDTGSCYGRPKTNIHVTDDFKTNIDKYDTLIIAPHTPSVDDIEATYLNQEIFSNIDYAQSKGINIIDLRYKQGIGSSDLHQLSIIEKKIRNLSTPIVFISSLFEHGNKDDVLLLLTKSLIAMGYKVHPVWSRQYGGEVVGSSFPYFMQELISEEEKIILFKDFLLYIESTIKPDVIIVSIPGAVMKFSEEITCGYGITNYLVASSIIPDFSIVCTHLSTSLEEVKQLDILFQYRFGYNVNAFVLSGFEYTYNPFLRDYRLSLEIHDASEINIAANRLHEEKKDTEIFNVFDKKHIEIISNMLIDDLGKDSHY